MEPEITNVTVAENDPLATLDDDDTLAVVPVACDFQKGTQQVTLP